MKMIVCLGLLKGKEQPNKKSRLFAGALRKTVGLPQGSYAKMRI